jgi:hypothetical protein
MKTITIGRPGMVVLFAAAIALALVLTLMAFRGDDSTFSVNDSAIAATSMALSG